MPMGSSLQEFAVPKGTSLSRLHRRLVERLSLDDDGASRVRRTWHDTFDWRLFRAGDELVRVVADGSSVVHWQARGAQAGSPKASLAARRLAGFVRDLPDSPLRDGLQPIVEMRALVPVATVRSDVRMLAKRDASDKVVVRVAIERLRLVGPGRSRTLGARVRVFPLRGYEKACERLCSAIEEELGLTPVPGDLLVTVLSALGQQPGGYSPKIDVLLDGTLRADMAARLVLRRLLEVMDANLEGMRADLDSEFLHDYRVAVRRTRSALGRLRGVFPAQAHARFQDDFRWLGQATGPTRDLDVYLLQFDEYTSRLPRGLREHLEPLHDLLCAEQAETHRRLVDVTHSERFQRLMDDWRAFLGQTVPFGAQPSAPSNAARRILEVAGRALWRSYKLARRQGCAITTESPAPMLHELRKTCKKLRYLLEFFTSLYPDDALVPLIDALKELQQCLGECQDLVVQCATLERLAERRRGEPGVGAETLVAIEVLVHQLRERQQTAREQFAPTFARFASPSQRRLAQSLFRPKSHPGDVGP